MKQAKILSISQFLVKLSLGLVLLQTPLVVFLWSRFPSQALIFKSMADFIIIVNFVLSGWLAWQNRTLFRQLRFWFWLTGGYILINLVAALGSLAYPRSLLAGIVINLRYLLIFITGLILSHLDKKFLAKISKITLIFGGVVVLFGILQITVLPKDFLANFGYSQTTIMPYLVIDQNDAYVRINSTLRGPNPLGALMVILASLTLSFFYFQGKIRTANKSNLLLFVGSLVILFVSHSRSAWLAAGIALALLLIFSIKTAKKLVWLTIISGLLIGALGLGVLLIKDKNHSLVDEFEHLILHENSETRHISSNQEHNNSVKFAWERISEKSLLGYGVGAAGSASLFRPVEQHHIIEQQFLFVWYELGVVGFLVFSLLWLVILQKIFIWRKNWLARAVFASGVGLVMIGLFLPVLVDSAVAISWWLLAGVLIGNLSYNKEQDGTKIN